MRVLIIANSRYKGGASGGDKIYESFRKYWPCEVVVKSVDTNDAKPSFFNYVHRICAGCLAALFECESYDLVYSTSDFLPDVLPALIHKGRGAKWCAGYYLHAFRENKVHFYTQKMVRQLIKWFADMVIVTNPTMYHIFPNKKKTWINGGIDLKLAGLSDEPKIYDAVWCGRIHYTKGVDELIEIWSLVRREKPNARLALIGDGDLGLDYVRKRIKFHFQDKPNGIFLMGYMGDERYQVYKQSKVVLYTTPLKYDHFSMAPVEAMACGCPMIAFDLETMQYFRNRMGMKGAWLVDKLSRAIIHLLNRPNDYKITSNNAYGWAQQFDYEKQALRVYNDIRKELFDGSSDNGWQGDGGDGFTRGPQRPSFGCA